MHLVKKTKQLVFDVSSARGAQQGAPHVSLQKLHVRGAFKIQQPDVYVELTGSDN